MSVSINDFSAWAAANRNTAVALNAQGDGIEAASNRIGFFDRFFRRSIVKEVRGAVMKDFTLALSVRYGATIAQRALAKDIKKVVFDRGGFPYHGCVKAVADAARAAGLEF